MASEATCRAAVYARVSTEDQVDGTSLATQRRRCRLHIEAEGWCVVDEFVDEGVSGAKASRPALDRLMHDARQGRIDVIVVLKLDRFGRSNRHLSATIGELDDLGVRFVSITEAFDSGTSTGRMHRDLLGVFAEFEREQIRERTMGGLRAIAADGFWPGGPPPFGFKIVNAGRHKRLALDDQEAAALREAVACIVERRMSTQSTASHLNALGYRLRRAPRWTHWNVRRILLEAPLTGSWTYARQRNTRNGKATKAPYGSPIVVDIPRVLDNDRYEQMRERLATTTTGHTTNKFYELARGILTGPCGGRFHGVNRKDRGLRQYRCANNHSAVRNRCDCRRLNADDIEFVVWEAVTSLLSEPERLLRMAHDYLGTRGEEVRVERQQIEAVERRITSLQATLTARVAEYIKAGVRADVVRAATKQVEDDIAALVRHRDTLRQWMNRSVEESGRVRRLWELAEIAHLRLGGLGPHERRLVLDLLDVRVTVSGWEKCSSCGGSGMTAGRSTGGRGTGVGCPACSAGGYVPLVRIDGRVYDRVVDAIAVEGGDLANGASNASVGDVTDVGLPFTVAVAVA